MFLKATNDKIDQYPYTVGNLRRDNPNTSFPKNIPTEMLESYGVFPVVAANEPEYDPELQWVSTAQTPVLISGRWTLEKTLVDFTQEEIDEREAQKVLSIKNQRAIAYQQEADPLFFKYQRGEGSERDWLDKIEEIRKRFPYPTEE
jgi:hypothetical protein